MRKLFRMIEAARRDAQRAEDLIHDPTSLRALRTDPEVALLAFELAAGAAGEQNGEQETVFVRRPRVVQAARRNPAVG